MLYCRYCDYFIIKTCKNETTNVDNFMCEYSNYIFPEDFEYLDAEHPCYAKK